jgi:N-terminal domain of toast_rack, DUF2154/Domain of unknown function (DUF5668)
MAQNGNPRRVSLVFPILLITIGGLFLYQNSHPAFNPWSFVWRFWPLILIFVGLGKIWDNVRRSKNPSATNDFPTGSTIGVLIFVLLLGLVLWKGRAFSKNRDFSSRMTHSSQTIDLQGAKTVSATVSMNAGDLVVNNGDTSHLLDAAFDYFDGSRTPKVDYSVSGDRGDLEISEDHSNVHVITPNDSTRWNLRFGDTTPLSLDVSMGAGQGNLNLRGLPLTNLTVKVGAGRVEADLTGDRKKDLDADIQGGVGEAVIHLPKKIGVVVNASGGIGTVDATGLKHEDGEYTNDAYGKSPVTIHLHVAGGIGRIQLIQEEPR